MTNKAFNKRRLFKELRYLIIIRCYCHIHFNCKKCLQTTKQKIIQAYFYALRYTVSKYCSLHQSFDAEKMPSSNSVGYLSDSLCMQST